ncbi:MAG: glutathione S-transferase N-terminal domain-containing protein [Proteobacteria bacterium]|nr:glutathione S-transferase N-terminal domain-containing protein [Pseudomonadota bacterium]MDA1059338.1 glutathione S-transferase N-terminal domain-containing protein [Pseudomonadota bacterium]
MSDMKLRFTPNPNYIHKVLVAAAEAGITDRLEYVLTGPFDSDSDLWRDNPLNKVPTLVLEDGEALFGGPVICEYFDSLHDGPKMFPPWGRTRFTALTQMMVGEGVFEAAVALDRESWRDAPERRADEVERQWLKIVRALDSMEEDAATQIGFHIGHICMAGGLSRLDYRVPEFGRILDAIDPAFEWRDSRPALAAWYENLLDRPSMRFTIDRDLNVARYERPVPPAA